MHVNMLNLLQEVFQLNQKQEYEKSQYFTLLHKLAFCLRIFYLLIHVEGENN